MKISSKYRKKSDRRVKIKTSNKHFLIRIITRFNKKKNHFSCTPCKRNCPHHLNLSPHTPHGTIFCTSGTAAYSMQCLYHKQRKTMKHCWWSLAYSFSSLVPLLLFFWQNIFALFFERDFFGAVKKLFCN